MNAFSRQQQWQHIQPVLCGMVSLRPGYFGQDPRSYEPDCQPFEEDYGF